MTKTGAWIAAAALAGGVLLAAPASAQFAKPEDAIKYRKSAMTLMGSHVGRIAAVVRGDRPFNAAEVQANAAVIETISHLPFDAFGPGTDKGDTRAKPDIWQNAAKFKSHSEDLQKATAALASASKSGSLDPVKAAFGGVGKVCKACHDDFRKD
jgi:cytochrome c556